MRTVLLTAALAGVALAQVSPADAQEREIITKLLASEKDSDKAWAAELTAKYGQARLVPDIVELLKSPERRVRLAALDALIRLNADPPEEAMSALLDTYGHFDAVLILMGRRLGAHRAFLEGLLDRQGNWYALNALLAVAPYQNHMTRLWNEWTLRLRILDIQQQDSVIAADAFGLAPTDRFPQEHEYALAPTPPGTAGNALVSGGPFDIEIIRTPAGYRPWSFDRSQFTTGLLGYFTRPTGEKYPETTLRWTGAEAYETDARELLRQWRVHITYMRGSLIGSKLLPPEAREWPIIEVVDERRDKSTPLPAFDWTF